MTKIFNFALKIKVGGREGGTCEILRPCHPPKIWNVHYIFMFSHFLLYNWGPLEKKLHPLSVLTHAGAEG